MESAPLPLVPPPSLLPRQEFPNPAPSALSSESTSLESLVHHRDWVAHDKPLEEVEKVFRERDVDYLALMRNGRVTGVCSRLRLGALLGSRFGFALYSRSGAHIAQVEHPLVFERGTAVREILNQAMARHGDEFHEDVVLVDGELGLLGLIPVEALAHLQTQLVRDQLAELQRQNEAQQRQHVDLFQANHALRQAQALYQGLFESNTLGVALLSAAGQVQAYNRRLAELLNFDDVRAASLDLRELVSGDLSDFDSVLRAYDRNQTASATRELALQVPGRGARLFRFTTGWITETGQVCACLDDITEQRDLERRMRRHEKQQLLDTMIGGIAHELNNQLTPVLGFAGLIELEASETTRRHAAFITKSVTEAAGMIRQLLQLAKPDAIQLRKIHLQQIVGDSLTLMKFKLMEAKCQTRVVLGSQPIFVLSDAVQLSQVLMNLFLNALQAMEGIDHPQLEIEVVGRGEHAAVTVADNGCGIEPEHLGRIFDPFFTTKSEDHGTGLGLSISHSIVRQHGGDITVESIPNCGARFTFTLPLARSGPAAEPTVLRDSRSPFRRKLNAHTRVLIVDDEEVVRKLLQEIIRTHFDCSIDVAANGLEALRLAEHGEYGMIISDIRMPGMNGPEFYEHLRAHRPVLADRLLFITGHAGDKALQAKVAQWQVPVLAKPFAVDRLIAACESFLPLEPLVSEMVHAAAEPTIHSRQTALVPDVG